MPKEQINYPRVRQIEQDGATLTVPDVSRVPDDICVHVGWNRAGWVQVSLSLYAERLAQIASQVGTDHEVSVYSETLSREEINKMIRALRKARDQAYGSDA